MAKRIIAIGGEPASGKSTLMKYILKQYKPLKTFKYGLVRGLYNKENNLYFLGIYDNSVFCGTDKLSMAVQPHFLKLIKELPQATFVFEGDRLFNQSLFDKQECEIVVLNVTDKTKKERHEQRNDNQSDQFKRSKKTKIKNILSKNKVTILNNDTEKDNQEAKKTILNLIKCQTNPTL
jgi:dephospho-CoA kinase